jgi:hypothetical protein
VVEKSFFVLLQTMKPEELIVLYFIKNNQYFINIKSIKTDNHELASTIRILEIRLSENNSIPTIMVLSGKSERVLAPTKPDTSRLLT